MEIDISAQWKTAVKARAKEIFHANHEGRLVKPWTPDDAFQMLFGMNSVERLEKEAFQEAINMAVERQLERQRYEADETAKRERLRKQIDAYSQAVIQAFDAKNIRYKVDDIPRR